MIDSDRAPEPEIDRPKTLLYVDDHGIDLALMRALLSQRPAWRLNMACDGEAACMIARREPHDLLLLDLMLPDGSGADLLRRLRQLPGLAQVPAIAVTAEDFDDFASAGFCEVLPKPLNLRLTLRRLDHFLCAELVSPLDAGEAGTDPRDVARGASAPTSVFAGAGCTTAARVAGRLIDRVKAQAAAHPVMSPVLRPAR